MSGIIGISATPDDGRLLQISDPRAHRIAPGQWFALTLDGRRLCLPVLDASTAESWLAFQLPPHAVSERVQRLRYGDAVKLDGPHGQCLTPAPVNRRLVLLTDTVGTAAALFAARAGDDYSVTPDLVLAEFNGPPPVRLRPSRFMVSGMPAGTIAGLAPLEDAGIASRAAQRDGLPGCYDGDLTGLLEHWLTRREASTRWGDAVTVLGSARFTARISTLLKGRVGQYATRDLPE